MLAFQGGDPTAFDTLFRRHKGCLVSFLYQMCFDRGLSEDISQITWMELINIVKEGKYQPDPGSKFRTYLYLIAKRKLIDKLRSASVRKRVDDPDGQIIAQVAEMEGAFFDSEERLEKQLRYRAYLAALNGLPWEQREVLMLRLQAGLSWEDIAKVTSSTYETVRSRGRYGIQKLRRQLGV